MSGQASNGGYSIFFDSMADMTYEEIVQAAREGAVVLWALGVIEEHGPHLPLATDVYLPTATLRKAKMLLTQNGQPSVIAPAFYWGVNQVTGRFPGSFDVRPEVMVELMTDVIRSLAKDGFRRLFCLSGHGDALHNQTLLAGLKKGCAAGDISGYFVTSPMQAARFGFAVDDPFVAVTDAAPPPPRKFADVHAGEGETSMMWALYPDVVRQEVIRALKSTDLGERELNEWRKGAEHAVKQTPLGYLGDPAVSDPARGEVISNNQARDVANAILRCCGRRPHDAVVP